MIYLDHAATTPVLPFAYKKAQRWLSGEEYGNPSSLHAVGNSARFAVDWARLSVAGLIGANCPEEIIFTSGGSEADNLALMGMAILLNEIGKPTILVSQIEHHAILRQREALNRFGITMKTTPVDRYGSVKLTALEEMLRAGDVGLVSVMWVNNEIGVIQDMKKISELCERYGVILHSDAVQAVGHIDVNVQENGIDMLSISGHKFGAMQGIGALYVRRRFMGGITSLIYGGGQEHGLRAGTENVGGIVSLGAAACSETPKIFSSNCASLRDVFLVRLQSACDGVTVNEHGEKRFQSDSILSLTVRGVEAEALLHLMNKDGVCISAASACSAGSLESSHVLLAIGKTEDEARSTVRISFGWNNTAAEVMEAADVMAANINKIRKMY